MPNAKLDVLLVLKDQLTAGIKGVSNRMKKFADSFRRNWLAVGAAIFIVKRAISSLITPSIEFESAFAGVKKTVEATNAEFKELEENLLSMSRRIPVAAKELAGIQEVAGQLGIRGVKNLTKFTEAIAKISVTTNLTQQSAAINFSRIASVINEPIENIEKMASSVVGLGNNFEVQEDEILNFAQRIAAMGKLAKLTTADLFGVAAALASVGVRAEAGGTAVNKVLLSLAKQGKTGSKALLDFVGELQASGDKAAQKLEELGFTEARTQRAFLSLAGAGDKLADAISLANDEFEKSTALNIEAAKRFETTASKIILIKNNITILQKEIGDKLTPAFEKLLKVTKAYVDFATGEDLKFTKLEILEQALKNINIQLSGRGGSAEGFFGDIGGFQLGTQNIERRRTVLVGLIGEERERLRVIEETLRKETELANSPLYGPENKIKDKVKAINTEMKDMVASAKSMEKALSVAFSKPLADMITGAKSAKEAFSDMGKAIVSVIAKFIAETVVAFTIGRTLQKLATIFSASQAAILAQAWAPAAIFASIATAGGAAVAGLAGVTGAMGVISGLSAAIAAASIVSAGTMHKGGMIRAHNGLAVGEVPIIAQTGEGILSRRGMGALGGEGELNALNQGRGGGGGDMYVEINYPKMSTREEVSELVRVLGFEMERQLRYARSS